MADEASIRDRLEHPIDFTVTDGTGIEKGALLKMTTDRTAIITSADNDTIAGIAAREKIASDGREQLAVFRRGVFDMVASGTITVGDAVSSAATHAVNHVHKAPAAINSAKIIGHALETASDNEKIQIDVNVGTGGNQVS